MNTNRLINFMMIMAMMINIVLPCLSCSAAQSSGADTISIMKNPFRYSGYYQDSESGLSYCNARYYSSELMQFISRDSYDLPNRYYYCGNDPVNKIDPDGHDASTIQQTLFSLLALPILGIVLSGLYAVTKGNRNSGDISDLYVDVDGTILKKVKKGQLQMDSRFTKLDTSNLRHGKYGDPAHGNVITDWDVYIDSSLIRDIKTAQLNGVRVTILSTGGWIEEGFKEATGLNFDAFVNKEELEKKNPQWKFSLFRGFCKGAAMQQLRQENDVPAGNAALLDDRYAQGESAKVAGFESFDPNSKKDKENLFARTKGHGNPKPEPALHVG